VLPFPELEPIILVLLRERERNMLKTIEENYERSLSDNKAAIEIGDIRADECIPYQLDEFEEIVDIIRNVRIDARGVTRLQMALEMLNDLSYVAGLNGTR
tara:strand:+ start:301 stop:600 length:300 start_codon:yes stop_codon:yes gene_type:complete